jgi:hypothetical protein
MAYACLTFLQAIAGGRKQAAQQLKIHEDVLERLGELTSKRGDPRTARKFERYITPSPLTHAEIVWVEAAIKAIIRRVGEREAIDTLPKINIGDLPEL